VNLDNMRIALRGLRVHRLRTALTTLGILIGVAAVILLVAVGQGISNLVQRQIETLGANAIYVFPQRAQSSSGASRSGTTTRRIELTPADLKALSDRTNVPDVVAVAPLVVTNVTASYEGATYALQSLTGTVPIYAQIRNVILEKGRFFDDQDIADHAKVGIIGKTVAKELFGPTGDPMGARIKFNGVKFRVIGVMQRKGSSGFQDQDDVFIAPLTAVQDSLTGNTGNYTFIAAQTAGRDRTKMAEAQVIATMRASHNLPPDEPNDFNIFNQASILAASQTAARVFTLLLGVVAAISLLVGGIGVMNIMLVTVTERTREIGIRKALGARRSDILGQFLVESVLVSALGGVLGIIIGVTGASLQLGPVRPVLEPFSIPLALGVSAAVGIFFGIYPANRAAALTPIEALRHE
jgi:putative ABC transport system permease protein